MIDKITTMMVLIKVVQLMIGTPPALKSIDQA